MPDLLTNSTSTALTAGIALANGQWDIQADIPSGDAASIAVYRVGDNGNDMPVAKDGAAIALTQGDSSKLVVSSGQVFKVQRSGGSEAVTVTANRLREL